MFEFIFIGITYSAGIPTLYPIVAIFFEFTYYFDMITILKYYMKTNVFSEELPIKSLQLFKYAIMLHIFFLVVIILKSEICRTTELKGEHFGEFNTKVDYIGNLYSTPMITVYAYIFCMLIYYLYKISYDSDPFVFLAKILIERIKKVNQKLKKNKEKLKKSMRKLSSFGTSIQDEKEEESKEHQESKRDLFNKEEHCER